MMFYEHLPPRFWTDCFSIAVFLINHLPSQHLNIESPLTILHYEYWDQSAFLILVSIDHISLIQSPFLVFLLAIA